MVNYSNYLRFDWNLVGLIFGSQELIYGVWFGSRLRSEITREWQRSNFQSTWIWLKFGSYDPCHGNEYTVLIWVKVKFKRHRWRSKVKFSKHLDLVEIWQVWYLGYGNEYTSLIWIMIIQGPEIWQVWSLVKVTDLPKSRNWRYKMSVSFASLILILWVNIKIWLGQMATFSVHFCFRLKFGQATFFNFAIVFVQ